MSSLFYPILQGTHGLLYHPILQIGTSKLNHNVRYRSGLISDEVRAEYWPASRSKRLTLSAGMNSRGVIGEETFWSWRLALVSSTHHSRQVAVLRPNHSQST